MSNKNGDYPLPVFEGHRLFYILESVYVKF